MSNSKTATNKRHAEGVSGKISIDTLDFQCENFGLIVYSDKHHVEYIYPLLLQLENVLKSQGICPRRLGEDIRSSEDYLDTLESLVDESALILVILDGFRPNVLFEFGYALSKRKPVIVLKSKDATINIKTLFRNTTDSGVSQRNFGLLCNPTLEVSFHLSDFGGKHISKIDWKAKESDPLFPPTVIKNELKKKKNEIVQEITRIRTKELPPTVPMEVLELIIEVFGYYYSKEKVSLENVKKLYLNLEDLAKTHDMKPPIKIYDMLSSIYIRQYEDTLDYSDKINHLIEAQKINNKILTLFVEKENFRSKILMENGEISQKLLFTLNEEQHGYVAIEAFEEAIGIFSRCHLKRDVAFANAKIGETYVIMSEINKPIINLNKGIESYIEALKTFTQDDFFYEYVQTQYKLASAYYKLSQIDNEIDNLKSAIKEVDKIRKLGYLKLALIGLRGDVLNLSGMLHSSLAEVLDSSDDYKKALEFYKEALKSCSLTKKPSDYATLHNNLGIYYARIADVEKDLELKKDNITKAIDCFSKALEVYTHEKFPLEYFNTKTNICELYRRLAGIENKAMNCKKAIEDLEKVLSVEKHKPGPKNRARAQYNLGLSYATLAEVENPVENFTKAIQCFNEFQKVITTKIDAEFYAMGQTNIAESYQKIFNITKQKENCKKALRAYKEALKVYRSIENNVRTQKAINEIQEEIENLSAL